jgi:hypothetical protein
MGSEPLRQSSKSTITSATPLGGLLQRQCARGQHTGSGSECEECKQKREVGLLQRAAIHPSALSPQPSDVPPIVHEVLRSPGQPLDAATRAFMEPRFGHDFSGVRVHTDVKAAESARAVNALAYTVGREVVFGADQYAPQTGVGQQLMAHELTHVMQSKGTARDGVGPYTIDPPQSVFEREAESIVKTGGLKPRLIRLPTISQSAPPTSLRRQQRAPEQSSPIDVTTQGGDVVIEGDPSARSDYVETAIRVIRLQGIGGTFLVFRGLEDTGNPDGTLPRQDIHFDPDPARYALNRVYSSRSAADMVIATMERTTGLTGWYTFYLENGVIYPTIISLTAAPRLTATLRHLVDWERAQAAEAEDAFIRLLGWYVGARFPPGLASGPAAESAFNAAQVAGRLFRSTSQIGNPGQRMIAAARQLSGMRDLGAWQKVEVTLEFFRRIGFSTSARGVIDEGAHWIMQSEDGLYAFRFLKDTGLIEYGRFDREALRYVWQVLR